ncbi:MAG: hypothetical protein EBY92_07530, partial [Actinobacteria bacterium]|nr:hypothetical protein [Actinomycetota bacterium]
VLVSGGHTMFVAMNSPHDYRVVGQTIDDAAGEAFDKVARFLGHYATESSVLIQLTRDHRRQHIATAHHHSNCSFVTTRLDAEHDGALVGRHIATPGHAVSHFAQLQSSRAARERHRPECQCTTSRWRRRDSRNTWVAHRPVQSQSADTSTVPTHLIAELQG